MARFEHALIQLVEAGLFESLLRDGAVQIIWHVLRRLQHITLKAGIQVSSSRRAGSGEQTSTYICRVLQVTHHCYRYHQLTPGGKKRTCNLKYIIVMLFVAVR